MKTYFDFAQGSPEYWAKRRGVPTASEASRIITAVEGKPSKGGFGYACELVAQIYDPSYPRMDGFASSAMRNGQLMEGEARAWLEMEIGQVRQVGFVTTDDGRFGCSPDALIVSGDEIVGGVEIKSPDPKTHVAWLTEALNGPLLPDDHKQQVHDCLAVTGLPYWIFASYVDGLPPFYVRVEPDAYTAKLKESLESFWCVYQMVLARVRELGPEFKPAAVADARAEEDAALACFGGTGPKDANLMNES